jgi:hypothetical protein
MASKVRCMLRLDKAMTRLMEGAGRLLPGAPVNPSGAGPDQLITGGLADGQVERVAQRLPCRRQAHRENGGCPQQCDLAAPGG